MNRYLRNCVLVVYLALFVSCSSNGETDTGQAAGPQNFTLTSLDGDEITLSELRGTVVIIDFWATWCPPCRNSIPALIKLFNKYKDQGFTILGISLEDRTTLESYRDAHKIPYPILIGNKEIARAYDIQAIPNMFIIDKKGKIRKTQLGFAPELEPMFDALIDSLVKE